ncbi:MAG: IS30 family transposase [Clostridia bacterium]|nr:IS30 family transposase [Clostridia bacterium]
MRKFKQLKRADRLRLETLLKAGHGKKEIAELLGVHISTIYREVKRGTFVALNPDLTTEIRYSPDIAHEKYKENLKAKGADIKIGNDMELANYIEDKIVNEDLSPAAVLGQIKVKGIKFKTTICVTTLYSYIDKNVFLRLTNKNLPVKKNKKRKYNKVKVQARANKGTSIEKRPEEIEKREEFGHWEMDTVIGKRGISKKSMLVLTERKTRKEIIEPLKQHTAEQVVKTLDKIERKCGAKFRELFKTITVDNGSEFSDCEGIERSKRNKQPRTKVYYCHPYSSYERGTNEVTNKMIRRKIPKSTNFDDKTLTDFKEIEDWVNEYSRKIFGYLSANDIFMQEISAIFGQ